MSDRRQRKKEQRAAKREAERKREQRRELVRRLLTAFGFGLIVIAIFAVSGIFAGDDPGDTPTSYEGFRDQPTACGAEAPPPETVMSFSEPEQQNDITASSDVTATIETSCGEIVIELDPATYPETVNSFVFLAREGFYDGQVFHRIAENFVIQGGDPQANGTGGPGYTIEDEFPEDEDFTYDEGTVAMANRGSNSTGSQFFIVIGDDGRHLTPLFNVLGEVTSGQETLERIADVPTGVAPGSVEESLPRESVYIESVTIDVSGS